MGSEGTENVKAMFLLFYSYQCCFFWGGGWGLGKVRSFGRES